MTVDTCDISLNGSYVSEASVSIGDSVIFHCTCLNSTVQWKLNGQDITTNTHYVINATSGTLTIPAVRSSDSGNYYCNSNNVSLIVAGTYIFHIILYAYFLVPIITVTGYYSNLTVGSSVSINCTTVPPISNSEIKWQSSSFNSDSNELIINPVMLSHNNKTFTCVVSSDLLYQPLTKNITLTVLSQLLHNTAYMMLIFIYHFRYKSIISFYQVSFRFTCYW